MALAVDSAPLHGFKAHCVVEVKIYNSSSAKVNTVYIVVYLFVYYLDILIRVQ